MYKYLLFDLDGTLTDPGLGITNSVIYALHKFDMKVSDRSALYKFIGPPLKDSFQKYYGFSDEQCDRAIRYYREYFKEQGMFENEVYDGIHDLLLTLKAKGRMLLAATSKPEAFAVEILRHFDLFRQSVYESPEGESLFFHHFRFLCHGPCCLSVQFLAGLRPG